ncbi:NUDIX hydrolase [Haloechinothrix sp. YIM 98757]|uniref:NUDIX hydrolase n=1 Tax=Haloechinothrix aidingensis TaxID=2752311 RepID=A0A838AFL3_9PSEU|nr:NUDIX hydrolase [Haloechinothrix aidingensis]MBA0127908.1 NUDIX hydrolase [Haloechinothrix aidingensis]
MTPEAARPTIAAAIIVQDGKVLLVQRRVKEGSLSWQFPAGEAEEGESAGQAAVREAREETGLTVAESKVLGERVHPATGRTMAYVACHVVEGSASVVDDDELADLAWLKHDQLAEYVPHGFYEPVQEYLDAALSS